MSRHNVAKNPQINILVIGVVFVATVISLLTGCSSTPSRGRQSPDQTTTEPNKTSSESKFDTPIVLGILNDPNCNPPEKYAQFISYLEKALPEAVGADVVIEQDFVPLSNLSRGKEQLRNHKWDIAFTTSPVLAIEAQDNNYTYAFRMFPDMPSFQAALFVRQDSPIQSMDDITPETIIALGEPNSVPSFRVPLYDLFGLMLTVDRDNSLQEIMEKVMKGQVQIGTGIYSVISQQSDQFRIIKQSRSLPLSGVYLSPELSTEEKKIIENVLAQADSKIQEDAHYSSDNKQYPEPNYYYFRGIEARAIKLENCVDWSHNPVSFYCTDNDTVPIEGATKGLINGFSLHSEAIHLEMRGDNGTPYLVILPITVMEDSQEISSLERLINKRVQITPDVVKIKEGGKTKLNIIKAGQIQLLE